MSSRRLVLLTLACTLEVLPGAVACSGKTQAEGTGGAGSTAGSGNGAVPSGVSGTAPGVSGAAQGMSGDVQSAASGAAQGGMAQGGATQGGASAGQGGSNWAGAPTAAAGSAGCLPVSQTRHARTAKSAGFKGDYAEDYGPLYYKNCTVAADCASACVKAGGTSDSCAASECVPSTEGPDHCLPPTYWVYLDQILTEGNSQESSVQVIMVNNPYRDQLLASNFQFEIPSGAKILGISFTVNEAAGSANMIADYSVRALANGNPVGLDRGHSKAWSTLFHPELYGDLADLWGTTWTADVINAEGFGIAITPLYLDTAGNERAYIDFIRGTVTYDTCK